jgi:hypothetical protein
LMLMVKIIGVWQDKYSEIMKRLYTDEFDKIREEKVIKFS